MTWQIIVGVMVIMFVGNFIKAAIGFGSALVMMPILSLLIGVKVAAPLFALTAVAGSIILVTNNRQSVNLGAASRLLGASMFGIPFGLYMLRNVPEAVVLTILGVILIGYGLYNLFSPQLPALQNDKWAYPAGFLGGILGGAYNTSGPPVIVYATLKQWEPDRFRATMQTFFMVITIPIAVGHLLTGLWVREVFVYLIVSIPSTLVAIYAGDRCHHMIPQATFLRIIYVFLIAIGLVLVI